MKLFISLLFFLSVCFPASAQEYLEQPICFTVKNNAPYSVYGDVATAPDKAEDGSQITHEATFSLKEGESVPMCTKGPVFPGNKVRVTLRTLIPVFECLSTIYPGATIKIQGMRDEENYRTKTWAECL